MGRRRRKKTGMRRKVDFDAVVIYNRKRVTGDELRRICEHRNLRRLTPTQRVTPIMCRALGMLVVIGCTGLSARRAIQLHIRDVMNMRLPRWAWPILGLWLRERLRRGMHRMLTEPALFCGIMPAPERARHATPRPLINQNVHRDLVRVFERCLLGDPSMWPTAYGISRASEDIRLKELVPPTPSIRKLLPQWQEEQQRSDDHHDALRQGAVRLSGRDRA